MTILPAIDIKNGKCVRLSALRARGYPVPTAEHFSETRKTTLVRARRL